MDTSPINVEGIISQLQESITSGDDDAAKILITAGSFIVVSDLTYRLMSAKISLSLPSLDDLKPTGFLESFSHWAKVLGDVISSIDVDLEKGLWDIKITCCGLGAAVAGVGMLVANHPEWISESIDAAQKAVSEAKAYGMKMLEAVSKGEGGEGSGDIIKTVLPLLLGGATLVPGIPPPP